MAYIFEGTFGGLSDSKASGIKGSFYRCVGIDGHSTPGHLKVHQKLSKHSGATVTELCKVAIPCSDGSKLWFSSESGKIWREVSGTYTLIHTTTTDPDNLSDTFTTSLSAAVNWLFLGARVLPSGSAFPALLSSIRGSGSGSATTLSQSFTAGSGSDRCLFVFAFNYTSETPASATFNGDAMSSIASGSFTGGGTTISYNLFYLINPDIATGNIVVTNGSATVDRCLSAALFTGVNQSSPISGFQSANATSSTSATLDVVGSGGFQTRLACLISTTATHTDAPSQTSIASGANAEGSDSLSYVASLGAAINLGGDEFGSYIYWATERLLFRVLTSSIATTWSPEIRGVFANGDDTYHPFAKTNNQMFIGDKYVVARVDEDHVFTDETEMDILAPERITAVSAYDTDLLVGTLNVTKARVLRWDTVAVSWIAEDEVEEKGVRAFIRDDNYVYAVVGDFGRIYFYNGEKLERSKNIPGDWSPSKTATVNHNAVGFVFGMPIFGLSNTTGNPALQGIYSLGSYSKDYTKVLDLSFPISSDELTGMTIGAIIVDGADVYASWKGAATVGVDKLDYTLKYASAYLESRSLLTDKRGIQKTLAELKAFYDSLPASCGVTFSYNVNNAGYVAMTDIDDSLLAALRTELTIEKVGSLQVKMAFDVSSNNAPIIEGIEVLEADE